MVNPHPAIVLRGSQHSAAILLSFIPISATHSGNVSILKKEVGSIHNVSASPPVTFSIELALLYSMKRYEAFLEGHWPEFSEPVVNIPGKKPVHRKRQFKGRERSLINWTNPPTTTDILKVQPKLRHH